MPFRFLPSVVFLALSLMSCGNGTPVEIPAGEFKEPLIRKNISLTREERKLMKRFAERRGWKMDVTGSGLMFMIYQAGNGIQAVEGHRATVEYEIRLLDGSLCYTSVEKGPRTFTVGRDRVEAGLHEGVQLMKVGDRARFVIPAYLAHGLTGDGNKIPPRASLVVDLHLLRLD